MRIKLKDKASKRLVVIELDRKILEKHGRPLAISEADGGWWLDNGLSTSGYQWEPVGEVAAFARLPLAGSVSFSPDSTVGQQLALIPDGE